MATGKVYLVGAGPGDPELLTLKAARVLSEAEVILVDDLVNPAVLQHARRDARVIGVGKRGGCRSTPQALIERLMIREARAGRTVVRLKGGDPSMFGRAGEEREALLRAGIAVETVSGVTAGLAGLAAAGIPVTHRDCAPGVIFVTGHTQDAGGPDWAALAATGLTLVIYMGVSRAREIAAALLAAGLAPTLPVAVLGACTTPAATTLRLDLAALAALPGDCKLPRPALLVVGEVVARGLVDALDAAWRSPREGIEITSALA